MKEEIIKRLLNLIKVKSILTFIAAGVFIYTVINNKLDESTTTAILMLVFNNLFTKKGSENNDKL